MPQIFLWNFVWLWFNKDRTLNQTITYRYTIYEDFEKVVVKSKADLYATIDEGDVDWFSEYDNSDEDMPPQDSDGRSHYNDYRYTECYSSIKPPDLISSKPKIEESKDDFPDLLNDQKEKQPEKPRDQDHEMKKPRLLLKQNYFAHVQPISEYTNGNISCF